MQTLHFALHIADTLLHLQKAGCPQYIEWRKSFDLKLVCTKDMQNLNQRMKKDLQNWLDKVSKLRTQYYALNYFTCLQLLRINREFYDLMNNPDHQISREVFLLLLSLSSDLTITDIEEVVRTAEHHLVSSKGAMLSLGNGDIVCNMDENDTLKEVAKLTEEEKEVYDICVEGYDFEPCMVLVAIHKVGLDEEEVAKWCFDPENKKMFEDTSKDEHSLTDLNETQIDCSNATVKELIELEYSEGLSIEAVKQCGENLEQCMEYCNSQILAQSDSGSISDTDKDDESILLEPAVMLCSDVDMSDTEDSCLSM